MRKMILMAGALALGSAVAVQAASPKDTIEARQKNFKAIGKAMKGTGDSFKSGTPDAALVKANAAIIASYADKVGTWFPAGTAMGGAVKSTAKPEIWSDKAGFAKAVADFSVAAKAFKLAANTGDLAASGKALGTLGGTCKGCHDKFKAKDHD
jgi:cytochrome c556